MAIDTAAKRSSCLDFEEVWTSGTPIPDGAVSQSDRQHGIWSYSGILIGAAATLVLGPFCFHEPIIYVPGSQEPATFTADGQEDAIFNPGSTEPVLGCD